MNSAPNESSREDAPPRAPGRIITFYSYKGGTGRSMALANVAWILAMHGRRVLVIDWDLEAPGLHRYYRPFLTDPEMAETPGLIDCFVHFAEAARLEGARQTTSTPAGRAWFHDYADLLRYSAPLDYEFPGDGVLDFVGAGQQGPTYGTRVNTFQWGEFYEKLGGGIFLEAMKARMREDYDFVLIDSRTGLSDTSGICTVQMPDDLVVCFTLNRQSIFGAAATAASADIQRRRADGTQGLRIWPVPTRVEVAEKERLEKARRIAREKFVPFLWHIPMARRPEYWGSAEVQYFPYYAYEEVLATLADLPRQTASLLNSMERLTAHLSNGEIPGMPSLPEETRVELLARYQPAEPEPCASGRKRTPLFYVSYSRADGSLPLIRDLAGLITQQFGTDAVFWDEKIPLGAKWEETLRQKLEMADAVIIVAGPRWQETTGGKLELDQALKLGKPIIPLLVGGASWENLPPELRDRRGFEISPDRWFDVLVGFVAQLVESFLKAEPERPTQPSNVDDPQKNQWGGSAESGGRRLTAKVRELTAGADWFFVDFAVECFSGEPLGGEVEFHLHPSFQPPIIRVPVQELRARLSLAVWGAFTVGVSADDGRTRLELDLAELSEAPETFRKR